MRDWEQMVRIELLCLRAKKLTHWGGEYKFSSNSQFKSVTDLWVLSQKNWDLGLFLQNGICFRSGLLGVKLGVRDLHVYWGSFFRVDTHGGRKVAEEALELAWPNRIVLHCMEEAGRLYPHSEQSPVWIISPGHFLERDSAGVQQQSAFPAARGVTAGNLASKYTFWKASRRCWA